VGRFPLSCLLSPGDVRRGSRKPAHQRLPSLPFRTPYTLACPGTNIYSSPAAAPAMLARQNLRKSLPILGVETMRLLVPEALASLARNFAPTLTPLSHKGSSHFRRIPIDVFQLYTSIQLVHQLDQASDFTKSPRH
jgi:hypothetical protein